MAGKSDFLENELLDHALGGGDYARPGTVYAALYTVAPTDAGGGTEVTGGSYARVSITNNATNFPAAAAGQKSNGTAITFPAATADWGLAVALGLFDASSGGNLLFWTGLVTNRQIYSGDQPSFAIGALIFTED